VTLPHISALPAEYSPLLETNPAYSLLPIAQGFNWEAAFAAVTCGSWYLVVFRSRHKADADEAYLTWLDAQAAAAAIRTPGFLYYFMGVPLADGHCLSFCLWNTQAAAQQGSADPAHREAMVKGLPAFEYYRLERYHVKKADGVITFEAVSPDPHHHAGAPADGTHGRAAAAR
jgi:heme-degrading monooxygenase HmoA